MTMRSFRYYLIITLFILFPIQSFSFRHLFQQPHISPSPSPSYYDGSNLCSRESRSCHLKNITACLIYNTHSEMCLSVHNNGESLQHVKIRILPAKNTIKELNITGYQMKEVNISLDVDLSSALALTTSDGDCVISTAAASPPENRYQKYSYGTYITPTNGAYLVILILIIGGVLTFYKLRTRGRHLDGVAYHELEMRNSTSVNMDENETENWDQDWDDQWDDEKPVKSGGDNHVLVKQANELNTKLPNSNGRKKEWDD